MTIIEAAKLSQDPLQKGVIETFAKSSVVLERLPFLPVSSNSYKYNREETLPGIAFRGINESYTESTGVINPVTEPLVILGGVSDYDRALVKTQGNLNDLRAVHDAMKAKAAALKFTKTFLKGDSSSEPREFDGLQVRLTGDQLIDAGSTSGGDALSLAKLDELIDAVEGSPDVLFMNKTMRRLLTAAARTYTVSGFITWDVDAFGRQIARYNDIPIAIIEQDNEGNDILPFTEANPGGGSAASTSIYAVRFGAKEYLSGLQCGGVDVIDMGLYSGGTAYRTLIEWIVGVAIFHPKAAARLQGIKNDTVTA